MTKILFPGRHHVLTNFQHNYLNMLLEADSNSLFDIDKNPLRCESIDEVIWAVTSANHHNTRRNPIPANRREAAIERFTTDLPGKHLVYHIPDRGTNSKFADFLIKEIDAQSEGKVVLTPENTIVACSTPEVISMYEKLGFRILPVEMLDRVPESYVALRPWDLVLAIAKSKGAWREDERYRKDVHSASKDILERYDLGDLIVRVHSDPTLGADGDLTETRDYNTYTRSFDDGADRKYALIKNFIRPGRVVDIGCCSGGIIKKMSDDDKLRESDLYGIEIARALYEICERRREDGYFGNSNTFFFQRNIMSGRIFEDNEINTTITFAITHEIESYIGRGALMHFLSQVHAQTARGGVYINVDVVGPEDKDQIIYMRLNKNDGSNDDPLKSFQNATRNELRDHLANLSSYSRFLRFANDFRAEENDKISYELEEIAGEEYIKISLGDACEFMSKKDYVDNWQSEMHERFCFWSFSDWQAALEKTGFDLLPESYAFRNEWIVENRFVGKSDEPIVELYTLDSGKLKLMDYPVTNVVLVSEKR